MTKKEKQTKAKLKKLYNWFY